MRREKCEGRGQCSCSKQLTWALTFSLPRRGRSAAAYNSADILGMSVGLLDVVWQAKKFGKRVILTERERNTYISICKYLTEGREKENLLMCNYIKITLKLTIPL